MLSNTWNSSTASLTSSFSKGNLSSIPGMDNSAIVAFRLLNTSSISAAAGTNRVDNFTVNGTAISSVPLPGAIWLFGSALMGMLGFKCRKD